MKLLLLVALALLFIGCNETPSGVASPNPSAAPAVGGVQEFRQNDGTTFKGQLVGDEHFNYIRLENGYVALYNNDKRRYEYAVIKDGRLQLSDVAVGTEPIPESIKPISTEQLQAIR